MTTTQVLWQPFDLVQISALPADDIDTSLTFSTSSQPPDVLGGHDQHELPPLDYSSAFQNAFSLNEGEALPSTQPPPPLDELSTTPAQEDDTDCFIDSTIPESGPAASFHTWEAFHAQASTSQRQKLLSESSSAFTAALADASLGSSTVLPHAPIVRAATAVLLGRSSAFFEWSEKNRTFVPALDQIAVSGLSTQMTTGCWERLTTQGSMYRRLRDVVSSSRARGPVLVTAAAVISFISNVLDSIDAHVLSADDTPDSILQVVVISDRLTPILELLWTTWSDTQSCRTDEQLLSSLCRREAALLGSMSVLTPVFTTLVQAVSKPWQSRLLQSLGLLGNTLSASSQSEALHDLVSEADCRLLDLVKANTEFLSQHVTDWRSQLSPAILDATSQRLTQSDGGHDQDTGDNSTAHLLTPILPATSNREPTTAEDDSTHDWQAFQFQSNLFESPTTSQVVERSATGNTDVSIRRLLHPSSQTATTLDSMLTATFDPVASIRTLVKEQANLTSRALSYHLLSTFKLEAHLERRFRYYMLGDPDFVDRLRTAIFGTVQDEDRPVHTLRLNDLSAVQWPPTTSNLSLCLMGIVGVLSISEHAKVSFTVRQLSEEAMEKACDAVSLHALDFLQLHVEIPPALQPVIGGDCVRDYDQIFSAMLLHTRMLHLVTKLRRRYPSTSFLMYHVASTLASHATQIVVPVAWQEMVAAARKSKENEMLDLDAFRQVHIDCLSRIKSGLFLRKRQLRINSAIEAVYSHILSLAHDRIRTQTQSEQNELLRLTEELIASIEEHVQRTKSEGVYEAAKLLLNRLALPRHS